MSVWQNEPSALKPSSPDCTTIKPARGYIAVLPCFTNENDSVSLSFSVRATCRLCAITPSGNAKSCVLSPSKSATRKNQRIPFFTILARYSAPESSTGDCSENTISPSVLPRENSSCAFSFFSRTRFFSRSNSTVSIFVLLLVTSWIISSARESADRHRLVTLAIDRIFFALPNFFVFSSKRAKKMPVRSESANTKTPFFASIALMRFLPVFFSPSKSLTAAFFSGKSASGISNSFQNAFHSRESSLL